MIAGRVMVTSVVCVMTITTNRKRRFRPQHLQGVGMNDGRRRQDE